MYRRGEDPGTEYYLPSDAAALPPNRRLSRHACSEEKQAESIVDKLCQRFRLSEDARQWRDIAFCLSLLPFKSEKSVKKLIDGLQHYRDKLHEEGVFLRFQEILTKARANKSPNKPDAELNEFEKVSSFGCVLFCSMSIYGPRPDFGGA